MSFLRFQMILVILITGCSTKSDQPHSFWPYLHSGMSMDSAKLLIAQTQWVRDTSPMQLLLDQKTNEFGFSMVQFKNIHLPGIRNGFTAMLNFGNNRLITFSLTEEPNILLRSSNRPPAHDRNDYLQLVAAISGLYGKPSKVDSLVHKYFDANDSIIVNRTYTTSWIDSTGNSIRYRSVMLDMPEGRLSFLGM
jgi:hypothetical protein